MQRITAPVQTEPQIDCLSMVWVLFQIMKRKYPAIPQLKATLCLSEGQAILDLEKKTQTGPMTFTIERSAYTIAKRDILRMAKHFYRQGTNAK